MKEKNRSEKRNPLKNDKVRYLIKIALLSAIAMLISKLEIPLWFAPEFYKLDLSAVFVLLGGFALGPTAAILITILKNLLKLLFFGSTSAYVGELADVVMLILLSVTAAIIYKKRKNIKGAIIGMIAGIIVMTAGACVFNYFVLIPFYTKFMSLDEIVAEGTKYNSLVTSLKRFIVFITAPFNLFKGFVCSVVTFFMYKRVSKILHI